MKSSKFFSCLLTLLFFSTWGVCRASQRPAPFSIRVSFSEPVGLDSLYLLMQNSFFAAGAESDRIGAKAQKDGSFVFPVQSGLSSGIFQIRQKLVPSAGRPQVAALAPLVTAQRWQAGDQILITVSKKHQGSPVGDPSYDYAFEFSGPGSKKYTVTQQVAFAYRLPRDCAAQELLSASDAFYRDPAGLKIQAALRELESLRSRLTASQYQLIKADVIGKSADRRFRAVRTQWASLTPAAWMNTPLRYDLDSVLATIDPAYIQQSSGLVRLIASKLHFESLVKEKGIQDCVNLIQANYQGTLRDKLLVSLLALGAGGDQTDAIFERVAAAVTDTACRAEVARLSASLPGINAKDFQMEDASGKTVRLSDFKGKVVLLDTWFTGCGGCLNYFRRVLKPAEEQLKGDGKTVFLTVSIDRIKESWLKSVASGKYVGEHSVNVYTDGQGSQHPWIRFYQVSTFPTVMILDENGIIFRIYRSPTHREINTPEALKITLDQARSH